MDQQQIFGFMLFHALSTTLHFQQNNKTENLTHLHQHFQSCLSAKCGGTHPSHHSEGSGVGPVFEVSLVYIRTTTSS